MQHVMDNAYENNQKLGKSKLQILDVGAYGRCFNEQ